MILYCRSFTLVLPKKFSTISYRNSKPFVSIRISRRIYWVNTQKYAYQLLPLNFSWFNNLSVCPQGIYSADVLPTKKTMEPKENPLVEMSWNWNRRDWVLQRPWSFYWNFFQPMRYLQAVSLIMSPVTMLDMWGISHWNCRVSFTLVDVTLLPSSGLSNWTHLFKNLPIL